MKRTGSKIEHCGALAFVLLFGISMQGCGSRIRHLPKLAGNALIKAPHTGIDIDAQGGVDMTVGHQSPSGIRIFDVSIGGSYQKTEASSASVKIQSGIYVR